VKTLRDVTDSLRSDGEKALVSFLTAGYPDEETFLRLLRASSDAGCQVIEIGIPFSDPIADGPVIQRSSKRALDDGMTLRRALELAARASEEISSALVIMSYVNPILRMGLDRFAETARDSGVSGVILPDVPLEESSEARAALARRDIALVDLVAPTSSDERIERIVREADGFLYLVSVTGVTGARTALSSDLGEFVARVRSRTELPLYVGFGVSDGKTAAEVTRHADGVIIGSAIIRMIESSSSSDEAVEGLRAFLTEVKQSIAAKPGSEA
jgi:tryptophan synthase alpha chain